MYTSYTYVVGSLPYGLSGYGRRGCSHKAVTMLSYSRGTTFGTVRQGDGLDA